MVALLREIELGLIEQTRAEQTGAQAIGGKVRLSEDDLAAAQVDGLLVIGLLEEEEAAFGKDPWAHGLKANGFVLEKFMEYAAAQGYIPKPLDIGAAFWTEDGLGSGSKMKASGLVGA